MTGVFGVDRTPTTTGDIAKAIGDDNTRRGGVRSDYKPRPKPPVDAKKIRGALAPAREAFVASIKKAEEPGDGGDRFNQIRTEDAWKKQVRGSRRANPTKIRAAVAAASTVKKGADVASISPFGVDHGVSKAFTKKGRERNAHNRAEDTRLRGKLTPAQRMATDGLTGLLSTAKDAPKGKKGAAVRSHARYLHGRGSGRSNSGARVHASEKHGYQIGKANGDTFANGDPKPTGGVLTAGGVGGALIGVGDKGSPARRAGAVLAAGALGTQALRVRNARNQAASSAPSAPGDVSKSTTPFSDMLVRQGVLR